MAALPQLTKDVREPQMRTASGGGGDPNDPDDDPRRRNQCRNEDREE